MNRSTTAVARDEGRTRVSFERRIATSVAGTAHVERAGRETAAGLGLGQAAASRLIAALLCAWPLLGQESVGGGWVRVTASRNGTDLVVVAEGPADFSQMLRRAATRRHDGWGLPRLAGCADDVTVRSDSSGTHLEMRLRLTD